MIDIFTNIVFNVKILPRPYMHLDNIVISNITREYDVAGNLLRIVYGMKSLRKILTSLFQNHYFI